MRKNPIGYGFKLMKSGHGKVKKKEKGKKVLAVTCWWSSSKVVAVLCEQTDRLLQAERQGHRQMAGVNT